ncbi:MULTISPECIES: PAS domain S-box protein [Methylobacterium]|uniref:Sensor protein FixL n=1 Tax=Methylobacterium bullatum TaxID=570505 RepID=A0AAV4Z656_9HYPH|nr:MULTISPECIES: PAS domain S-box protein [Methylobacterium]MBD8902216.1 histidine kinase [Methylobacterium bullatum]TXN28840.1 PAS domain S-box protein [Methylobacterium sp. WL19]GJD38979.1 Sensor protein FixL [Methylobacterium bullatum]
MSDQSIPAGINVSQLVEAAGDAIVVSDPDGAIVVWNASAERIFGFSSSEALGQSLDLITPERQRQRHWDGYAKTMRTGITRYGTEVLRVPALHKDGRSLSIAFTVGLLNGPDGSVIGILAIIRDETRRWNDERQMRKRLSELESAAA